MNSYDNRERPRLRPSKSIPCRFPRRSDATFVVFDLSEIGVSVEGPPVAEVGEECILELMIQPEAPDRPLGLLVRHERLFPSRDGQPDLTGWELVRHLDSDGSERLGKFLRLHCS